MLKTTYINKKFVLKIIFYIFEYIQNLDQLLSKCKKVRVIISQVKSHFC